MIVPENLVLKAPAGFNLPLKDDGIGEIVDTQPGRETPVEWLAINKIDRSNSLTRDQSIAPVGIPMDEREAVPVLRSSDHRLRVVCK